MNKTQIFLLLRESIRELSQENDLFKPLAPEVSLTANLESIGLDHILLPDILQALRTRLAGHDLSSCLENMASINTINDLVVRLQKALSHGLPDPCLVYVDDEEENLFVFKRRFNKLFKIKYFTEPFVAMEYILNDPTVVLVLTDEVMPGLTGNQLCDRIHALKPMLKFILLTGNPNDQDDLVYNTMRKNRFFEFLRKPLDFENRFEELKQLFASILEVDVGSR